MKEKECFKCKERKPLTDFYKHQMMADGHVNKCKECNKLDVRQNRNKRVEYYREYDRKRGNRHPPEYLKKYRKDNPEKYKAHMMVNNHISSGKLTRPSHCQGCGDKCKPEGHHEDYSRPLDLTWLCSGCHKFLHKMRVF